MPTEDPSPNEFRWTGFKHTSPATVEPQAVPHKSPISVVVLAAGDRLKVEFLPYNYDGYGATPSAPTVTLLLTLSEEEGRLIEAFRRFKAVMLAPEATFTWRTHGTGC
jgi:hypothetical protein